MLRTIRATALLAGSTLLLGACSMSDLPGLDTGPDLAAEDLITLTRPMVMPDGYYGEETTVITAETITGRYVLPDGTEIFSVEQELDAEDRELLEQAAEDYLEWEPSVSPEERMDCMDAGMLTVEVSGSLEHESSMQDCAPDSPLRDLTVQTRDTQGERVDQLARPFADWAVEIRPWAGDGPDEAAPVESYDIQGEAFSDGVWVTPENPPDSWGTELTAATNDPERFLVPWGRSGPVLAELNRVLLAQDQLGCDAPSGEIRIVDRGDPDQAWTHPVCSGQPTELLLEELRGL